jgi:hypothetical protein
VLALQLRKPANTYRAKYETDCAIPQIAHGQILYVPAQKLLVQLIRPVLADVLVELESVQV